MAVPALPVGAGALAMPVMAEDGGAQAAVAMAEGGGARAAPGLDLSAMESEGAVVASIQFHC